jgi:hypothetical protein
MSIAQQNRQTYTGGLYLRQGVSVMWECYLLMTGKVNNLPRLYMLAAILKIIISIGHHSKDQRHGSHPKNIAQC